MDITLRVPVREPSGGIRKVISNKRSDQNWRIVSVQSLKSADSA